MRQAWTGPDLRQNTSQQLASLCSTLSEVTHTLAEAEQGYVETKLKMIIILLKILKIGQQEKLTDLEVSVPRSLSVHFFTASLFLLKLKH